MNIIHIVLGKANPDRMNGVNKVVDNLAKEQTALGHNTSVWGITETYDEKPAERVYTLKLFPSTKNKFTIHKDLEDAIAKTANDTVFHLHGGFILEFYPIAKLLKKHQLDFIFTPHGNYAANAMKKNSLYKYFYFNFFEKKIIESCKALHCLGNGEWEDIQRLLTVSHAVILPNGQNMDEINITSHPSFKKKEPVFGFCGRITKDQKGLDLLLEGFNQYVNEKGQGKLWIIGEGEYLREMQRLSFDHIYNDRIVFWGAQYGDQKFKLLASMDAFYHTSRNEGLPTAILEACAVGIPCVVSQYTNMGEYINVHKAGIVLQKNIPQAIAESMHQIETYKEAGILDNMGNRAQEMIAAHFNWSRIANSLIEVYQKKPLGNE